MPRNASGESWTVTSRVSTGASEIGARSGTPTSVVSSSILAPRGPLEGGQDTAVAGTPADVPVDPRANRVRVRVRVLGHERRRSHDEPGRAISALDRPFLDERPLQLGQLAVVPVHSLDGGDLTTLERGRGREARAARSPVDVDRARTTTAVATGKLRTGQSQALA